MLKYILFILAIVIIISCQKPANKPAVNSINFHGIISTDEVGNIIYNNDSTDWKLSDTWTATEAGLFKSSEPTCNTPFNGIVMAYPNPCKGYMSFEYHKSQKAHFDFCVVDRYYKIVLNNDSLNTKNDSLKTANYLIDLSKYKGGDTLRMYYKFFTNTCECRGHGDIVVK